MGRVLLASLLLTCPHILLFTETKMRAAAAMLLLVVFALTGLVESEEDMPLKIENDEVALEREEMAPLEERAGKKKCERNFDLLDCDGCNFNLTRGRCYYSAKFIDNTFAVDEEGFTNDEAGVKKCAAAVQKKTFYKSTGGLFIRKKYGRACPAPPCCLGIDQPIIRGHGCDEEKYWCFK